MSLLTKIKSLLQGEAEEDYHVPSPVPRPTSLSERKQKGMSIGRDPSLDDPEVTRNMRDGTRHSDDPYATAAWEVDPTSGRRRLARINPAHTAKKTPNNPYDTSNDLDPWKRKD